MKYKTHAATGALAAILGIKHGLLGVLSLSASHGFIIFVLLGALLPDLDHPKSKMGRKVPILSHLLKFFAGHRGLYHSLLGCGVTAFLAFLAFRFFGMNWELYVFAITLGFISHLVVDSLNPKGIAWLKPFHGARLKGPIKTGSFLENVLLVFLLMYLSVLVWRHGYSLLKFL